MNRQYIAILDAVSVMSGFVSGVLLWYGFLTTNTGAYMFNTPGGERHWQVLVRHDWLLNWGLGLLVLAFAAQAPKVIQNLFDAFRKG